ncbi:MAG: acyltransferase family protein [Candidatus Limimorpha sp.]
MTVKKHFVSLDGLRGIAALMVLLFHLFEAVAFSMGRQEQTLFHGFLSVDFFLILSGFVMGYAYDNEWNEMSYLKFFKKRLIRLHPMVVLGVSFGLVIFLFQGGRQWDSTSAGIPAIAISFVLSLLLLPSPPAADIRGNTEIFPLDGPLWSLFFEYIGNVLYALVLRRLSDRSLRLWVATSGIAFLSIGVFGPYGTLGYGWSSEWISILGGFLRMSFDFSLGLLLIRIFKSREYKETKSISFIACSALLIMLLSMPSLGKYNVLYEFFCIALCFPMFIMRCAKCSVPHGVKAKALSFIGNLSYPLYAIHYPFVYLYIGIVGKGNGFFASHNVLLLTICGVASLLAGYLSMRFYDSPVRRKLTALSFSNRKSGK